MTANSGRVIWIDDTSHLDGSVSPDSVHFTSIGGFDSSSFIAIRRISDGVITKKYDTVFKNNYPRPYPLFPWSIVGVLFSENGRYLYSITSDYSYRTPEKKETNYIFKIDLITDQLVFIRKDSSIYDFVKLPNTDTIIFWNSNGLSFYNTDSLKEFKHYKDRGTYEISRSGRYITTKHDPGNIYTWDIQCDSIIRRNHLDSLDLWGLAYTQNDSIIIISALPKGVWQWKLIFYNVLSGIKIKEKLMHYTLGNVLLTPANFEVSPDGTKLLVTGPYGIYMFPLSLNPITHEEDENTKTLIQIIPNPTTDFLEISYPPSINRMVNPTVDGIAIFNVFGEKVMSTSPQPSPSWS